MCRRAASECFQSIKIRIVPGKEGRMNGQGWNFVSDAAQEGKQAGTASASFSGSPLCLDTIMVHKPLEWQDTQGQL